MKKPFKTLADRQKRNIFLTVLAVMLITVSVCFLLCRHALNAEAQVRYVGLKKIISEKIAKTVNAMEMSAMNVFDEVGKHLDSPEAVIAALKSKTHLNPEVRGYFAAFEPNYFPQEGRWFEPYVHHRDSSEFEYTQVGSARHDYTKSDWYIRGKKSRDSFWSDPYYYYDGTSISGHYVTFVKPVFDAKDNLVCVCGADMTFEWLTRDLEDALLHMSENEMLNKYRLYRSDYSAVVLNHDGTCISHPHGKGVSIAEDFILKDLAQNRSGMVDMEINGEDCTVYYGPIDNVDWSVAVIVPKSNIWVPLKYLGLGLLAVSVIGMLVVWLVVRRTRYEEVA